MALLVSLASYYRPYIHTLLMTYFTHIYNNNTPHSHLAWESKKPFIISFITLCFIQPKINELSTVVFQGSMP